ncbi:hypothetical protein LptCag_1396 [Leptospirillum ferriphilum]|jgi:hypothetical protein|uniref:Uncharacterized protein n=1 Tax=Leptospirillum ferriphilum TaxID=178606 RepID=A0A094YKE7_9BACT|nr:hypothetical protein LptCag_1396 [Leptospirillum ferriphilum]
MKIVRTFEKNILWVVLLVGLAWFLGGVGKPPVSRAIMASMPQMGNGIGAGKSMPVSCPMKESLPCCKGKLQITLCQTALCVLSEPSQEAPVSGAVRIHPPAFRIILDSALNLPKPMMDNQSLHAPFPPRFSVSSPINRPLLI